MAGSNWNKWDLHVHTPASFEHQFKLDGAVQSDKAEEKLWEKYVDELERETEVKAVGITDYYSLDGYKKVLELNRKGRLQNFELILPNIELRLENAFPREKGKDTHSMNYHVIFSDLLDPETIESEFLSQLSFKTYNGEARALTRASIEEAGVQAKSLGNKPKSLSDYQAGCMSVKIDVNDVFSILREKESLFGGRHIAVLALDGFSVREWKGAAGDVWRRLVRSSHAVFSANEGTREFLLGKRDGINIFLEKYGPLTPCIHGSDAHSYEKLFKPNEDRFCWIKGELTFSGLRQILYEPDLRIKIAEESPNRRLSIFTLSELKLENGVINNSLSLTDKPVPLNSGLVAIIGGQGTGKTAILDLISHCFEDRCKRGDPRKGDAHSFVQRIEAEAPNLTAQLTFLDGTIWEKELAGEEVFGKTKMTYLPQDAINQYSADSRKVHDKISGLVFSSDQVFKSGLLENFREAEKDIKKHLSIITRTIATIKVREATVSDEYLKTLKEDIDLKIGNLEDLEKAYSDFAGSEGDSSNVEALTTSLTELKSRKASLNSTNTHVSEIFTELSNFKGVKGKIRDLSKNSVVREWEGELATVNIEPALDSFRALRAFIGERSISIEESVTTVQKQIEGLSEIEQTKANLVQQKEQATEAVSEAKNALEYAQKERSDIEGMKNSCAEAFVESLEALHKQRTLYSQILQIFSDGKSEIMRSVEFEASITFDREGFLQKADDIFHSRSVKQTDINQMAERLEILCQKFKSADELENYKSAVLSKSDCRKPSKGMTDILELMYDEWFKVETKIYFNGKALEVLSMGERGTALLTIFLAEGNHLLIIDQPEGNVDGRYIYEVLVPALRAAKQRRQIIIATHDANLVINADADQIIVAKCDDGVISYYSGAIENPTIREEATTVLEGGREAFRKREQRYRL